MARPRKYGREEYFKIVELKEKGYSMREITARYTFTLSLPYTKSTPASS